ncbi:ArsR/SmtB family transcription factor [Arthrobacter sp. ok362]|uniref:ArsR/SmtB family transcription factor n=1 Tax=Arthrobacter sp. ok362 TaxID=1761745 RepID=UPI0034A1AF59
MNTSPTRFSTSLQRERGLERRPVESNFRSAESHGPGRSIRHSVKAGAEANQTLRWPRLNRDLEHGLALRRVFSSTVKVRILQLLIDGPRTPCTLSADLQLAPSTVSNHLAGLHGFGAVCSVSSGRHRFYSLSPRYRALLTDGSSEHAAAFDGLQSGALARPPRSTAFGLSAGRAGERGT